MKTWSGKIKNNRSEVEKDKCVKIVLREIITEEHDGNMFAKEMFLPELAQ